MTPQEHAAWDDDYAAAADERRDAERATGDPQNFPHLVENNGGHPIARFANVADAEDYAALYLGLRIAGKATGNDLAPLSERQPIADRLRSLAAEHGEKAVYMLSYDADFLREVADRIAPERVDFGGTP